MPPPQPCPPPAPPLLPRPSALPLSVAGCWSSKGRRLRPSVQSRMAREALIPTGHGGSMLEPVLVVLVFAILPEVLVALLLGVEASNAKATTVGKMSNVSTSCDTLRAANTNPDVDLAGFTCRLQCRHAEERVVRSPAQDARCCWITNKKECTSTKQKWNPCGTVVCSKIVWIAFNKRNTHRISINITAQHKTQNIP